MPDDHDATVPEQHVPVTLDDAEHARLVAVVTAASPHGPVVLRQLWDELVASYGEEAASRVWQEALASSDIGQT